MNKEEPLSRLLGLILRIYKNRLTALLKENNITLRPEQFMILHELSVGEDLTQQDLSNHLQKDKSIVLRQIATLMEAGYVIRLQDKVDKRKKKLSLTKKGSDMLNKIEEIAQSLSEELIRGVSREEFIIFKRVITKMKENSGIEYESCDYWRKSIINK